MVSHIFEDLRKRKAPTGGINFLLLPHGVWSVSISMLLIGNGCPCRAEPGAARPLSTFLLTASSAFLRTPRIASISISSQSLFLTIWSGSGAEISAGAKPIIFERSSSWLRDRQASSRRRLLSPAPSRLRNTKMAGASDVRLSRRDGGRHDS
jgi:hypothetical protein